MEIKTQLEDLTLIELNVLLEHLRLGQAHLQEYLNTNQFNALIKLGSLSGTQKENVNFDKKEGTGSAALAVNTVITSIFGTWMGFAGFMEFKLARFTHLLSVCLVTAVVSGILGYYSFKLAKSQVRTAVITQKLGNIEYYLIQLINQKRREETENIITYLNKNLVSFSLGGKNETNQFDSKEAIADWLTRLNETLQQKVSSLPQNEIYQIYKDELGKIKQKLKRILSRNISIIEKDNLKIELNPKTEQKLDKKMDFIKILTNPNLVISKQKLRPHILTPRNLLIILIQLVPTLLGCFASMFVFLSGGPGLAKEFGAHTLLAILTNPYARMIELTIAIGITIYYCALNVYNNYKGFKRNAELEKTEKLIVNEETVMIEINNKLNMLKKVKEQVRKIKYVYKVLKKVTEYLASTNDGTIEKINKNNYQLKSTKVLEN